jgi:hypothetical protein
MDRVKRTHSPSRVGSATADQLSSVVDVCMGTRPSIGRGRSKNKKYSPESGGT